MTPRECLRVAMDLGTPDRVPVMAQLSIGHMLKQLGGSPVEFWHDGDVFADGLVRLREIYDFDGILISLYGHNPRWRTEIQERKTIGGEEVVTWSHGTSLAYTSDDLPRPYVRERRTIQLSSLNESDIPDTLDYIPVSQDLHFRIYPQTRFKIFSDVRRRIGETFSLHGEVTSPFDYYLDCVGYQQGLIGLIEFPGEAKRILSRFASLVSRLALDMCDTGIDAMKISSPFAGAGFISPNMYREFVLPYEAEIVRAVHGKNTHVYVHTCGSIGDRLEMMLESGIDGLECLDPPPLGDVELKDAKQRLQGRGFIKGNVDSVNTLLNKGPVEILDDLQAIVQTGKRGGGFILSTACSVAPHVRRENVKLLRKAAELWGPGDD
jgi:hypothetical protein